MKHRSIPSVTDSPLKGKKPLMRQDMNRMHVEEMEREDKSASDLFHYKKHSVDLTRIRDSCSMC